MQAREFFTDVIAREEQIKEAKEELKAAKDSFAQCNNITTKGLEKAIKEYKQYLKDEAEFRVVSEDADRVFEAMVDSGFLWHRAGNHQLRT